MFLYRGMADKLSLELRLPLRAVVSSDFHGVGHEGWLFQPHLNVDLKGVPNVGDSLRDLQAAAAVESLPILVLTGKGTLTQRDGGLPDAFLR